MRRVIIAYFWNMRNILCNFGKGSAPLTNLAGYTNEFPGFSQKTSWISWEVSATSV